MALFNRRREQPTSIESEQERLRAIRLAAEEELGRLRRELVERVAVVEGRERELADALARVRPGGLPLAPMDDAAITHAQVGLTAHAQELNRREAELTARERAYRKMEADLARRAKGRQETPEEHLARIEKRVAALQEAEKAFAKTRAELAARSDELDRREATLLERERASLVAGESASGLSRAELAEIDERLSRLERTTREASSVEQGFGDALRTLETKGLRDAPSA